MSEGPTPQTPTLRACFQKQPGAKPEELDMFVGPENGWRAVRGSAVQWVRSL